MAESLTLENVALVAPPKSATFRDIRDIWSTPFLQAHAAHRQAEKMSHFEPKRATCRVIAIPAGGIALLGRKKVFYLIFAMNMPPVSGRIWVLQQADPRKTALDRCRMLVEELKVEELKVTQTILRKN